MARDVEFNYTASDRTGPATESVARRAKSTQDKINKEQDKAFKEFTKTATTIAGAGSKIGVLFGENAAAGLSKMAPAMTPILAGVGIAAAPVIGASIAGAIIGGAGIGGVVGGVALAARNPEVKARAQSLGATIMGGLQARSNVFIEPVLDSLDIVERKWDGMGDNVGKIFANSSRYVAPLTEGIGHAVDRVVDLIAKLTGIKTAGPVIDAISMGIAGLGDAINDAFSSLEDNGVDAAVALRQVFQVLEAIIRATGMVVNGLTEAYGLIAKFGLFGRDAQLEYLRLSENAKLATDSSITTALALQGVKNAGAGAAGALSELAQQTGNLTQQNQSLYASTTNAAEAIARTTETIRKNGEGLSLNTQKGRENRAALSNLAAALSKNYEEYLKVNGAGAGAERVANRNRAAFIQLAEKAGYSAGKARDLADKLLGIPAKRTPQVNLTGNAAARADEIIDKIRAIRGKTVTISIVKNTIENITEGFKKQRTGGFSAAATYAATSPGTGQYRTGGVRPVAVESTVNVALDGSPFYAYTARAIDRADRRRDWRARVGYKTGVV